MTERSLTQRATAEALGAALLLLAIVGSGIAAERLTDDVALVLLVNALATALGLGAAIATFGPISGAHFNPAVTLWLAIDRGIRWAALPVYVAAQIGGALVGAAAANLMFELPAVEVAVTRRTGAHLWLSEAIAVIGLLLVIASAVRLRGGQGLAAAVAAYVGAAIWFTGSTAFASPAVTVGRTITDTFTGIAPLDVAPFVAVQLTAGLGAVLLIRWLMPASHRTRPRSARSDDPAHGHRASRAGDRELD